MTSATYNYDPNDDCDDNEQYDDENFLLLGRRDTRRLDFAQAIINLRNTLRYFREFSFTFRAFD